MDCPKCQGMKLKVETYEGVQLDKCPKCQGIWLDEGELIQIVKTEEETFPEELLHETISDAFNGVPKKEVEEDVHCPKCSKAMRPVNYDYGSGVVIDRCAEHGIWLDGKELDKVQVHAEHWQQQAELNKGEWTKLVNDAGSASNAASDSKMPAIFKPFAYVIERVLFKVN
ncbi:zf-TFIIB domain-containing protein [bacterium]|nr:zf-TFIIB domain-containing protein [bacterium]